MSQPIQYWVLPSIIIRGSLFMKSSWSHIFLFRLLFSMNLLDKGVSHKHMTTKELLIVSTLTVCDKQASTRLYGFIFWMKSLIYVVHPLILDTSIRNSHFPSDSVDQAYVGLPLVPRLHPHLRHSYHCSSPRPWCSWRSIIFSVFSPCGFNLTSPTTNLLME